MLESKDQCTAILNNRTRCFRPAVMESKTDKTEKRCLICYKLYCNPADYKPYVPDEEKES